MSSSVKHSGGSVMAWACMAASGVGSLIFIDDVTHDSSSRMNSEVNKNILSANIWRNASKLIGRNFIMQQDNDPKHTANTTKQLHYAEKMESFKLAISPPEEEIEWKTP